jgi:hypothetical protein
LKTPAALEKVKILIDHVDQSYPDKLIATLLRLELLGTEQTSSASDFYVVLSKIVRTIMLTRANFKT